MSNPSSRLTISQTPFFAPPSSALLQFHFFAVSINAKRIAGTKKYFKYVGTPGEHMNVAQTLMIVSS
jgi:hypothetical protein